MKGWLYTVRKVKHYIDKTRHGCYCGRTVEYLNTLPHELQGRASQKPKISCQVLRSFEVQPSRTSSKIPSVADPPIFSLFREANGEMDMVGMLD